jgi:uncharacterized protein with beta-barrel porin domain
MRSSLDALITRASLDFVATTRNEFIADAIIDSEAMASSPLLKNVCAKVSSQLSGEIDTLCDLLSISKRSFIESALIEALAKAKQIIRDEGVHETLERFSSAPDASDASSSCADCGK